MKKLFALFLLVASSTANSALITSNGDAALNGATVEDFNGITQGYYSSLSISGATIVGNGASMRILNDGNASNYGISGNALQNYSGAPSSFDIIFDNFVSAFGIFGGAYNNSWTFQAFDALDNLIEQYTVTPGCCSPRFYGIDANNIKRVNLSNGSSDWVVFDDLYYVQGQGQVPVPAPLALLGLGLAILGFTVKRKA